MAKKSNPIISIGTSLVLVVFIILALITFAIMSAVSANSDYRASTAAAYRTTAYYQAVNTANEKLAEIDMALKAKYAANPDEYFSSVKDMLPKVETVESQENTAYFIIPISDTQELYVEFAIIVPQENAGGYNLNAMVVRQVGKWQPDDSLNLIK